MSPQTSRDRLVEERQARRSVAFRARAKRDLEEVLGDDDPRIKVFAPDTADVPREFCLVLTPYAGPWKGLQLHFTVQWDLEGERQWPVFSPRILMDPSIKHPCFDSGVINPDGMGMYGKVIDTIAEDGLRERHNLRQNPFGTLQAFFTNVLHLFSAPKLIHYDDGQDYLWNMREPTIVSYLDEEGYAALQPPGVEKSPCCQKIPGCCTCGQETSSLQGLRKTQWESDSRPDIVLPLDDSQLSYISKHSVHKVKTLEPEAGRLHPFEYPTTYWLSILQSISSTVCTNCPYGSSALPCLAPSIVRRVSTPDCLLVPPSLCKLDILTHDILLDIARWLEASTLQVFGIAYPRFDELVPCLLQTRELRCSLLRKPYESDPNPIMGARYNGAHGARRYFVFLESFEHDTDISYDYNTGDPHEYPAHFLPLAFNPEHFGRAQKEIETRWATVDEIITSVDQDRCTLNSRECSFCKKSHSSHGLPDCSKRRKAKDRTLHRIRAIIALMEATVTQQSSSWVELERIEPEPNYIIGQQVDPSEAAQSNSNAGFGGGGGGDGYDEDDEFSRCACCIPALRGPGAEGGVVRETQQSVTWYCHLLHLVLSICRKHPEIIPEAKSTIQSYIESGEQKFTVHNILVLVMVVSILEPDGRRRASWSPFDSPFLRKVFNNHIQEDIPILLVKEESVSPFRLVKTFEQLEGPLRPFMQHLALVRALTETYAGNVERLDRNCGFIDPQLRERIVREIQLGNKAKTWRELFRIVGFEEGPRMGRARFCEMLRELLPKVSGETARISKKNLKGRKVVVSPLEQARKEAEMGFTAKRYW